jgi:hypothetical protein
MKKILDFLNGVVAFIVQILSSVVALLDSIKTISVSAIKLALPVFGFLIIWDCLFKPTIGVLDNILSIFSKVGVQGQTLTTLLIVFGAVLIFSYKNPSVK